MWWTSLTPRVKQMIPHHTVRNPHKLYSEQSVWTCASPRQTTPWRSADRRPAIENWLGSAHVVHQSDPLVQKHTRSSRWARGTKEKISDTVFILNLERLHRKNTNTHRISWINTESTEILRETHLFTFSFYPKNLESWGGNDQNPNLLTNSSRFLSNHVASISINKQGTSIAEWD